MRLCYVAFHKTRASCSSFVRIIFVRLGAVQKGRLTIGEEVVMKFRAFSDRGGVICENSDVRKLFLKNQISKFSPSSLVKTKNNNKSRFHINITFEYLLKCSTGRGTTNPGQLIPDCNSS